MSTLQHVYLSAHGKWNVAPWQDETAQIGVRLAITNGLAQPAKGTPFTIPVDHGDIAFETSTTAGTNGTLSQTWTARLGPVGSTIDMDAARQIGLAEDLRTMLAAMANRVSSDFSWTHIKIAPQDSLGYTGPTGSSTYDLTTPIVGTSTTDALPPEVAVCCTLRAPINGRRGRGRVYIPGLTVSQCDSNGTLLAGTRTALANAMVAFVDAIEDEPGLDVWAPTLMVTSAGKADGVRPSEVRVGDHFDVQRRRQDQAPETYTTVAL